MREYSFFSKTFSEQYEISHKRKPDLKIFIKNSPVPFEWGPAFLLLEKICPEGKLKSEIEVIFDLFNCQISRENLVNDRCVTKNIEG